MNRKFDSDSDDDEFLGFQNSWKFDNFHPRRAATRFNGVSGPSVLHQLEASPLLYFLLCWTEEMWKHIVHETNGYVMFYTMLILRISFVSSFLVGHTTTASTSSVVDKYLFGSVVSCWCDYKYYCCIIMHNCK